MVRRQERRVHQPFRVTQHAILVRGAHFVRGVVEGHHVGSEVVNGAVPALGSRHVDEGRVVVLVEFKLEVRTTPSHLAIVVVVVLVARSQRSVEVRVLVPAVVWRVVVIGPKHVPQRPVVAARVVACIDARAESQLVRQRRVEVGQGPKPTVVIVGNANEVGAFALAVFIHVESVGPKFKQLVGIPRALQVQRAVGQALPWRAGQGLAPAAAKARIGRGRQRRLVRQAPHITNGDDGLEVLVLTGVVASHVPKRRVHLPSLFVVVVEHLLVVHHELVEAASAVDDGRFRQSIHHRIVLVHAGLPLLIGNQPLGQVCVVFVHLHLVRTLPMTLRSAKRREAQVVVAHGFSPLEVVCVGFRFQTVREALVGFVGSYEVQESLVLVAKYAAQAVSVVAVRPHLSLVIDGPVGRLVATRQNVDGSTHRRDGELAGPKAALHLRGPNDEVQSGPVAPVHPTVLHVIHGDPVHHDREVRLVKPANRDTGISVTSTLLRGVHTGRGVQHEWQVTTGQFLLDLSGQDVGERHGSLSRNHHICGDHGLLHDERLHPKSHRSGSTFALHLTDLAGVSDVGHFQRGHPFGHRHGKHPIEVRGDHGIPRFDVGSDQRLSRQGIFNDPVDGAQLRSGCCCACPKHQRNSPQRLQCKHVIPHLRTTRRVARVPFSSTTSIK